MLSYHPTDAADDGAAMNPRMPCHIVVQGLIYPYAYIFNPRCERTMTAYPAFYNLNKSLVSVPYGSLMT